MKGPSLTGVVCIAVLEVAAAAYAGGVDGGVVTGDVFTRDGVAMSGREFKAFEDSLTHRKELVMCAETTTGGYTSYEGTSPKGDRYVVKHETVNGRSIAEAVKQPK
jgi:hypothetical protein